MPRIPVGRKAARHPQWAVTQVMSGSATKKLTLVPELKIAVAVARSMGASRLLIFRRVVLPHMVPSLFSGLRLAMSATLLGVILAELYGSQAGIGYYTQVFTNSFDPAGMFALVAMLAVMAIILNEIVRRAERRASFWRVTSR